MRKTFTLLPLCLVVFLGIAQVEAIHVKVHDGAEIPEVFALGESHFIFECESEIEKAWILSDSSKWNIEKGKQDDYVIECNVDSRTNVVDLDSTLILVLKLQNGNTIKLTAPIRPYADIKVLPFSTIKIDPFSKQLTCSEKIGFHATWDYPSYVQKRMRVMVILDMELCASDSTLSRFTAWYDAGDRTRLQDFLIYTAFKDLSIKVRNIRTLHLFSQNGKVPPLTLANGYPTEWELNCGE